MPMEILNNKLKVQQIGKYRFLILNENRMDIEAKLNHSKRLLLDGLVSFFDTEIFSRTYYMYDVTGFITLEQYLKQELSKQQALVLIKSLASTLAQINEHEVAFNQLIFNDSLILVNAATGKASYLYYPFSRTSVTYNTVVDQLRGVVGKLITEELENEQYIPKLLNCCNQMDFSFSSLAEMCEELLSQQPIKKKNMMDGLKSSIGFVKRQKPERTSDKTEENSSVETPMPQRPMVIEAFGTNVEDSKFSRAERVKVADAAAIIGSPTVQAIYLVNTKDQTRIQINRNIFRIGSDEELSDYVLPDESIGKRHATIIRKGGKYYLIDNYSQTGTRVNGETATSGLECLLSDGSEIQIGNYCWQFCLVGY